MPRWCSRTRAGLGLIAAGALVLAAPAAWADAAGAPGPAPSLELTFVGDIIFGRFIEGGFAPIDTTPDPFASVRPLLASDLTIANLETPVVAAPPAESPWDSRMRFVATPAQIATLPAAGIRVVSLANNHWYDMRAAGVRETPGHLAAAGVTAVGAARLVDDPAPPVRAETVTVRGWRIGLVAVAAVRNTHQRTGEPVLPYAHGTALATAVEAAIGAARPGHDLVLVLVHWGTEYADQPHAWQTRAARRWIDVGAAAVIGHHPHVLQAIERYQGGLIAYSLGNFLFDNTTEPVRHTGVLRLRFVRAAGGSGAPCLADPVFHPAMLSKQPDHHPEPATGARLRLVERRLRRLSALRPARTTWRLDGDRLVTAGGCRAAAPPPAPR